MRTVKIAKPQLTTAQNCKNSTFKSQSQCLTKMYNDFQSSMVPVREIFLLLNFSKLTSYSEKNSIHIPILSLGDQKNAPAYYCLSQR